MKYAALRGVAIVPEIEMPGHSLALLVCHPELSCTGKIADDIFPFFKGPMITANVLCPGNEDTFKLLQDVIDEVVEVFPSKYIHVGGDEVPKTRWKVCPKCQARIKAEGLHSEAELESYFIRRMEKYLAYKGRCLIGWDEILEGGIAPDAAVMSWRGMRGGIAAAKAGHQVVMSPTSHCYFDYDYRAIDERRAYSFDPIAGLSAQEARLVLGLQANFWSHQDREPALVDKQLFPRLLSIAERGWSPASATDWDSFAPAQAIWSGFAGSGSRTTSCRQTERGYLPWRRFPKPSPLRPSTTKPAGCNWPSRFIGASLPSNRIRRAFGICLA